MKLFLCAARGVEFPNWLTRTLKVYIDALPGFSPISCPNGLNTFLQLPPWNSSLCGKVDEQNIPSKNRGASEAPLTDQVQLTGQLVVRSLDDLF